MHYWIMLLRLAIVLVPAYVAAYLTGEMVWVVPTLVGSGLVAAGIKSKTPTTRVDEDGDPGGYVNRCVNDIRRRPSQPLSQRRVKGGEKVYPRGGWTIWSRPWGVRVSPRARCRASVRNWTWWWMASMGRPLGGGP